MCAGSLLPSPPLWGYLQPVLQLQTAVSPPELLELEAQTTGSQMSPSMMSPSMMFERAEHEVPSRRTAQSCWVGAGESG